MNVFLEDDFVILQTHLCKHTYLLGLPESNNCLALSISLHKLVEASFQLLLLTESLFVIHPDEKPRQYVFI